MPFCSDAILSLATLTWHDLGAPPSLSVGYISGVYTNSGMLGRLNNALDTNFSFSGDAPCIVGCFGSEEAAIYEMMYSQQWYNTARTSLLTSLSCGTNNMGAAWTVLKEGDSVIQRDSPTKVLALYNQSIVEANKQLNLAIGKWRLNHTHPATVDAETLASYPTP